MCTGFRLKPESLSVKIAGSHVGQVCELSISDARAWFATVAETLTPQRADIARRILKEIEERLQFLVDVGLNYLSLGRASATLSGGESQRIRLASQIGSGLTGVLYVLDEPSIGLHQRDNERLLGTLRRLRDIGNTVLVVEHDEDAIRQADHLIDIGPGCRGRGRADHRPGHAGGGGGASRTASPAPISRAVAPCRCRPSAGNSTARRCSG